MRNTLQPATSTPWRSDENGPATESISCLLGNPESGMNTATSLREVLTFMRLLWALDHRLRLASQRMQKAVGVTGPQRLALRMIGQFPEASAGELADLLFVHPSTLASLLKRMEASDLIRRTGDPRDRRRTVVELTAKGAAVDALRRGTVEHAVRTVLSANSSAKICDVRDILEQLADALDEVSRLAVRPRSRHRGSSRRRSARKRG